MAQSPDEKSYVEITLKAMVCCGFCMGRDGRMEIRYMQRPKET